MLAPSNEDELELQLSEPTDAVRDAFARRSGDLIVLSRRENGAFAVPYGSTCGRRLSTNHCCKSIYRLSSRCATSGLEY